MNPSRRGVLGLIPAGLFGGKQLAKEVLDSAVTQSGLSGAGVALNAVGNLAPGYFDKEHKVSAPLKILKIASREWQDKHWKLTQVNSLDPDIVSCGSWSLSYKVLKQRERNFHDSIANKKSYWERVMTGDNMEDEWL